MPNDDDKPRPERATYSRNPWLVGFAVGLMAGVTFGAARLGRKTGGSVAVETIARETPRPAPSTAKSVRAVLVRTFKAFNGDQIPAAAASVTFYVLLALFPALSAFVSLYGLIADVAVARRQISALGGLLPGGAVTVLTDQLTRLASVDHGNLGAAFFVSLVVSVWSANAGLKALIAGLNTAYEIRENRGFILLNLVSLGFTAGAIVLSVVSVAAVVDAPRLLAQFGLAKFASVSGVRWPALLLVSALLISILYRYAPAHRAVRWRWISPGSALASVGWIMMSVAFSWYVGNFGHYDKVYGSLGAIVGFLTWIWLCLMIVLAGAELNCELSGDRRKSVGAANATSLGDH